MRATIKLFSEVLVAGLALWPALSAAESGPPTKRETVVFSEGLKGRISDSRLRRAKLVFDDSALRVEVDDEPPERFEYEELQVRRGRESRRLPLLSKEIWATALAFTGVLVATGGLGAGAVYLATTLGTFYYPYVGDLLLKRHGSHWWSLHSNAKHRCVFLYLPRKKRARMAILEELERRAKKELIVRPPGPQRGLELRAGLVIGEAAPDFTATTVEGSPWSLSQSKGRLTLLNFWATWCAPCRDEMPDLQELHRLHSERGLDVIGISGEDSQTIREFLSSEGFTFQALHDHGFEIHRRYSVNSIPTTVVIGRDGSVLEHIQGFASKKALNRAVLPHLLPLQGGPDP